jgi:hypothetical protein
MLQLGKAAKPFYAGEGQMTRLQSATDRQALSLEGHPTAYEHTALIAGQGGVDHKPRRSWELGVLSANALIEVRVSKIGRPGVISAMITPAA